jgi:hypothetical protein
MMLDKAFAANTLTHPTAATNSVDLFQAVASLCGLEGMSLSARATDLAARIGEHNHYLFVLVDGLGMNHAVRFPAGGFFATTLATQLHSVFPSTTAAALTSLATCRWPGEHGVVGWHTYYPEFKRVVTPLLFTERGTGYDCRELGLSPPDIIDGRSVLEDFSRNVRSFLPKLITGEFAVWARGGRETTYFGSHRELLRRLKSHTRSLSGPGYSYVYLLTVDSYSHHDGISSARVTEEIAVIDGLLSRIRNSLPSRVRMIVTADHGLLDVENGLRFQLRDEDTLMRHLVVGPTGEATTPVFHVKPGELGAFREVFEKHPASEYFDLHTPTELQRRGLYGPAPLSDAAVCHLGDLVGIATRVALLSYVPPGQKPVNHVAVHGGLRPGEVVVPLFLA